MKTFNEFAGNLQEQIEYKKVAMQSKVTSSRLYQGMYKVTFKSYDDHGNIYDVEVFIERNLESSRKSAAWTWRGEATNLTTKESKMLDYTEPQPSKKEVMHYIDLMRENGIEVVGLRA